MTTKLIDLNQSNLTSPDKFLENYQLIREQSDQPKLKNVSEKLNICQIPWVDKIYCINLEASSDRKIHMKKEFQKHQMLGTFFNAIHPRHKEFKRRYFQPKWVDQGSNQARCFCTEACGHRVRKLRNTEVSISLSHYHIYDKIVRKEYHWTLVCEDDVIFNQNFSQIVTQVIGPDFWQEKGGPDGEPMIIFCGGAKDNPQMKIIALEKFKPIKMKNGCYSNYCYLINLNAAKLLRRKFFPINRPEDSFKRYWINRGRINCYKISPATIGELSSGTNFDSQFNRLSLFRAPPKAKNINKKTSKKIGKKRLISYNR